jgi:hypothetical protein
MRYEVSIGNANGGFCGHLRIAFTPFAGYHVGRREQEGHRRRALHDLCFRAVFLRTSQLVSDIWGNID